MDDAKAREACDLIWSYWQQKKQFGSLPDDLRPDTREDGYAIQAHLERKSRHPLWGWKIAASSKIGQQMLGIDGPLGGRLFSEMILPLETPILLDNNSMRVAEPEFVFLMGSNLPVRQIPYTPEEVMAAVAGLHLGVEIPGTRYADYATAGGPQLIADDACANVFVLGPEAPKLWRDLNLAAQRVACTVSGRYEREGIGANVLGDPRVALTWLANELSRQGVALRTGQYVTTGTCAAPLEVQQGDRVAVDYGRLGRMVVHFA